MRTKRAGLLLLPLAVAVLNLLIIFFPRESLAAARDGLYLWSYNVLPGVLPFVIGSNLLMSLGAVNFMGTIVSPVMKGLFRIPGAGGFALIIGLICGYPLGAKVVCELRLNKELTKTQAQRLIAFSNNCGPLFILGAVSAGMFSSQISGYFLLGTHYAGALVIGLLMRFYGAKKGEKEIPNITNKQSKIHILALKAMETARSGGGIRFCFAQAFGNSVMNSMETMLLVGGLPNA